MRSRILLAALVFAGCATPEAKKACYPVASWSSPVFRCAAPVAAAPVVEAPAPEPAAPEPEPEAEVAEPEPPKARLGDDTIDLSETVQFDEDSANLMPRSKELLDDVARELNEHPELLKVQIEGHADSTAGARHNMKLSKERVEAVKAYLVDKGIGAKRLSTKAFGETKPLSDNKTDEGRQKNRRVEFRVLKKKK
jgi:outer membrane protein OmpA-like peptidoglycan-associated protein